MELRKYQQSGVDFLTDRRRCLLADEMGVGKTPQLIRAATGSILVVAPPSLHANWWREIDRWAKGSGDWQVTSYHSLTDMSVKDGHGKVAGVVRPEFRRDWDTAIFDEAHHLKGRNTGYAKAGVKIAARSERVYLATGTPVKNWGHEIFMLLRALYPGDPRFSSFWRWADTWFQQDERQFYVGGRRVKTRNVGNLRKMLTWEQFVESNGLADRMLRRTLDDTDLDLPGYQLIEVPIEMGEEQSRAYRTMEQDFLLEAPRRVMAFSAGSQWSHLLRITSGLNYHPAIGTGPNAKADYLKDLLRWDLRGEPLVIFTQYRHTAHSLADDLGWDTEVVTGDMTSAEQDEAIQNFQDGSTNVLIGTYGSLGEGHTLTRASKMVLFETSPVPSDTDQAIGRIYRFGQDRRCTIWRLYVLDTADGYYVERVLPAKRSHAAGVMTALDFRDWRSDAHLVE
jgi:SNF2 family DNA or RNA helicase